MSEYTEIVEYRDMAEAMREHLENSYNLYMIQGNKVEAHETVKAMMEYRLIDENDNRVSTKTNIFAGATGVNVKDSNNWGLFDYRRKDSNGFMARYLYTQLRNYGVFHSKTIPHWGKRVEGNYSGDIKISSYDIKVKVTQENYAMGVRKAVDDLEKIFNKHGAYHHSMHWFRALANAGVIRIFRIEVVGEVMTQHKNLGYIVVYMGDDGRITAETVIQYDNVIKCWINVRGFMTHIDDVITEVVPKVEVKKHFYGPGSAIKYQDNQVKTSQIMDKDHEERMAKAAAEKKVADAERLVKENEKLARKLAKAKK